MENNILDSIDVLEEANERGVKLVLNNGALSAKSDTKIDNDLLIKIKENKTGIIQYLEKFQGREKIEKLPKVTSYNYDDIQKIPLSFSQERLWFTDKLHGSVEYHVPIIFQLNGCLNETVLEETFQTLIKRHKVLRTVIKTEEGKGYQEIIPFNEWKLSSVKLKNREGVDHNISSYLETPFNLAKDYMLRAKLYEIGKEEYVLAIIMHHIATDAWSQDLLVTEFVSLYEILNSGSTIEKLPELSLQYSDYALWQREYIEGAILDKQLSYWKNKLGGVSKLALQTDYPRPLIQSTKGAKIDLELDSKLYLSIQELCRQEEVTLFMFLLTSFKVLLSKYSGQEDICVGTPIANRTQSELENIVGFFVNTLALRSNINSNNSFREILHDVKEDSLEGFDNQLVSFEKVVDSVLETRDMSMTPLFQVMFSLHQASKEKGEEKLGLENLTLTPYEHEEVTANFDLTLTAIEEDNKSGVSLVLSYCTDLFKESTIKGMLHHYHELLRSIINEVNKPVNFLSIISSEEKEELLNTYNATETSYSKEKSIIDVFSEQVNDFSDKTALVFYGETMSYKDLDEKSNQIANGLQFLKIKEGARIGILFNRGFDMIVSMIGILKAGFTYVPLDPKLPISRLNFIIEDAGLEKIIYKEENLKVPLFKNEALFLSIDLLLESKVLKSLEYNRKLDSGAYVMYTSGTTGMPKGILVTDENILTLGYDPSIRITSTDKVLQWSNYAFDGCIYEIFGSLLNGATLYLIQNSSASNLEDLSKTIKEEQLTVTFLTPALFNSFVDHGLSSLKSLRILIFGGEKASLSHVKRGLDYLGSGILVNGYGPTETTTFATHHIINTIPEQAQSIPIGKPLSNTQLYVLDAYENLTPKGVVGELYIGGKGVSKGYLNNEELTTAKFLKNRFTGEGKIYKTGDLVRWLSDGTIDFVGRVDTQVKIRGYRIELGEIENVLFNSDLISNCCVLVKEDSKGNKRLVGYVVTENDLEREKLEDFLRESLPDYMVPRIWVELETIPLTNNGKIDRKRLPTPNIENVSTVVYVAPTNKKEEQLVTIWQELLDIERIGIKDNFFELGGHSLLIIKLLSELQKQDLKAEVKDVFSNPTIEELASKLKGGADIYRVPANGIEAGCSYITPDMVPLVALEQESLDVIMDMIPGGAGNIQDMYPLAPLQEGMYFHHLMSSGEENKSDVYILPSVFSFSSLEKRDEFIGALSFIIDRHDVLRTCILSANLPHAVQVVQREASLVIEELVLEGNKSVKEELEEIVEGTHWMDVSQAPLLQLKTVEDAEEGRYYLILNQHHIILDHVGLERIIEEVSLYLEGKKEDLEAPVLYRNFIGHTLHQQSINDSEGYFKSRFESIEEPTLPYGLQDVQGDGVEVKEASIILKKELSDKIFEISTDLQMSPATIFHAAFGLVVGVCSGQKEQVVFGTVLSGRLQGVLGAERSLGLFINTLPLVCNLNKNVSEYLKNIQEELTGILPYEQTSLTDIQGWSGVGRQFPLFSGILNYRHSEEKLEEEEGESEVLEDLDFLAGKERTNYPFSLNVDYLGTSHGFSLTIQVEKSLVPERILSYVEHTLNQLIIHLSQEDVKVCDLSIVPKEEKKTLVEVFNTTEVAYPKDKTLVDLFEAQVLKTPDKVAVVFEETKLTYKELNSKANQLAHYLVNNGVEPEDLVAIGLDRSMNMLIGILGILKSGGAYVPIDPEYPEDRISYIIENAEIKLLLSTSDKITEFNFIEDLEIVLLDSDWSSIEKESNENLPNLCNPSQLAYVIYTSGSTGKPKGVMNEHEGVVNRLLWAQSEYELTTEDVVLQKTSFSFDVSVWELFWPHQCGATLVLAKPGGHKDARYLKELIDTEGITTIHFVPSMLRAFLNEISLGDCVSLQRVLCSGEALKLDDVSFFKKKIKDVQLENLYGPTEAAIDVASWSVPLDIHLDKVLIGKPVGNTQLYILDSNLEVLPIGVPGELCIGGVQVARGYLNREDLTLEKFVENPFREGERLYKTGDLARWQEDGNIDYVGRLDYQVKIRGYRVELGEVESVLQQYQGIVTCCVVVKSDISGSDNLIGYVVGEGLDKHLLEEHLKMQLPEYMIPKIWVFLEEMPLTNSGKIARRALPSPNMGDLSTAVYVAPTTKEEKLLVATWEKILAIEKIGVYDNFFELGGHSLLIVKLMSELQKYHLQVGVKDFFDYPTIRELSLRLKGKEGAYSVPANGIQKDSSYITPNMVPLVNFEQESLDIIMEAVPGGVSNIQDIYPLAPLQEGMYFHYLMSEKAKGDVYIIPSLFSFSSLKERNEFIDALSFVVNRHDMLRTCVLSKNLPHAVQVVLKEVTLIPEELQLNGTVAVEKQLENLVEEGKQWMDLSKAPLLQLKTVEDIDEEVFYLLLNRHHIILDHVSLEIITEEIGAYLEGKTDLLEEPVLYRNFIGHTLYQQSINNSERYFKTRFEDVEQPTLPFGLQDIKGDGTEVEETTTILSEELSNTIFEIATNLKASPATIFHAAFGLVVGICSGQEKQAVFGTVLSGRLQGSLDVDRSLGLFMNTLPIRCNLHCNTLDYLAQVQEELTGLLSYEQTSLTDVQGWSGVGRQFPLFSGLLNYRHSEQKESLDIDDLELVANKERTNYPFSLNVDYLGRENGFALTMQVSNSLSSNRILSYIEKALAQITEHLFDKEVNVTDFSIVPIEERKLLLKEFNTTEIDYGSNTTLVSLFESQALKTPNKVAVIYEEMTLTYKELNEKSNQLANYLIHKGVQREDLVAICIDRSLEMLIGLLGILKSGGAYVPIDPDYPRDRIAYIIDDAKINLIISTANRVSSFDFLEETKHILLDTDWNIINREAKENVSSLCKPSQLAYVIYTSGSTGKPKGVMNEHGGVVNGLIWAQSMYGLSSEDIVLQKTSFSFDVSVWELFWAHQCGATLVLAKREGHKDTRYLKELIDLEGITMIHFVPSMLRVFLNEISLGDCKSLQRVLSSGEALKLDDVYLFQEKFEGVALEDLYGPTEAGVHVTKWSVPLNTDINKILIGKPVSNTQLYILNKNLEVVPIGVSGELCIGGVQVARGYLNKSDLTADKFISNPFREGERLYKTGDLACWQEDGNVDYIGRLDDQVKIRGYRVELGEIENVLLQHEDIENCCVLAKNDHLENNRLIGYVVGKQSDKQVLQEYLKEQLPDYMVPQIWVFLEKMPLTNSGKIARRELPTPDIEDLSTAIYMAPRNKKEELLVTIWQDLLGIEKIGVNDNFFELGGHSLLIIKFLSELQKKGVQVEVQDVFSSSTIAKLVLKLKDASEAYHVPENGIKENSSYITPEMVPLVNLEQASLDVIMNTVEGGAANIQDIYPLAPLQEGMYFHHLMSGGEEKKSDVYILPSVFSFSNLEKRDEFIEALSFIIDRHDVLRTCILSVDLPHAVQVVQRKVNLDIEELVLTGDKTVKEELEDIVEYGTHWMDVSQAPLLQLKTADDIEQETYYLLLNQHHIILDHVGLERIIEEVSMYLEGDKESLEVPILYRNFIGHTLYQQSINDSESYFKSRFKSIEEPTLPYGLNDVQGDGTEIVEETMLLPKELANKIFTISTDLQMSPAAIFHAAFGLVIGICSNQTEQVVFGTVLSGRLQGILGAERSLGLFINTLPLVCDLNYKVSEYLNQIQKELTGILPYEQTPLADVQSWSGVGKQVPLFSGILNYRHSEDVSSLEDLELIEEDSDLDFISSKERANYPFSLNVDYLGKENGFSLTVQVDKKLNPLRILSYVNKALNELLSNISNSNINVANLSIIPSEEKEILFRDFNNTKEDYKEETTLVDLFKDQVLQTPNRLAIVFEGEKLTYKELDEKSNRFANYLISNYGVTTGDFVGLKVARNNWWIITMMGVLKSGAVYVPIDPDYPQDRIDYIENDSECKLIVTTKLLESYAEIAESYDAAIPSISLISSLLAYVIYTSGSTGKPKGVMIEHKGIVNTILSQISILGVKKDSKCLQFANQCFDASISEIFLGILSGAALYIVSEEKKYNPAYFITYLKENGISLATLPPAFVKLLNVEKLESLQILLTAGEEAHLESAKAFKSKGGFYVNAYGPTETSICATMFEGEIHNSVPIGKPIANTEIFILNQSQALVPIGIIGELCVSGAGLARGYLNKEDLTKEKFIPHPFKKGERLYRTGDAARWLENGNIDFIGRLDNQVKIRGYRVELGEIENVLSGISEVSNCCVLAKKDSLDTNQLVGYVVVNGLDKRELQTALKTKLPDYMVPRIWVQLEEIPITSNGKINKRALPEPSISDLSSFEYVAPSSFTEIKIIELLAELLKLDKDLISTKANIIELGVHSLKAMSLLAKLKKTYKVQIPFSTIFTIGSIEELAYYIDHVEELNQEEIEKAPSAKWYPASPSQKRLFALQKVNITSVAYNIQEAVEIPDNFKENQIQEAFKVLVDRHESLRTSFMIKEGEVFQKIHDKIELPFKIISEKEVDKELRVFNKAFDLEKGPLFRIKFIKEQNVVLLNMHHIITDGRSQTILGNELLAILEGQNLLPITLQYKDYAYWLSLPKQQENLLTKENYWVNRFSEEVPDLKLPFDFQRTNKQDYLGKSIAFKLSKENTQFLRELSEKNRTTLYANILTIWSVLLSKLGAVEDLVIGTPVLGRNNDSLMNLVGMFVNTVPVRLYPKGDLTFSEYLKEVGNSAIKDFENQEYPFEAILEALNYKVDISRNPLFDTMFNLISDEDIEIENTEIHEEGVIRSNTIESKFDLNLKAFDLTDDLLFTLDYRTSLFTDKTIENIVKRLHQIVTVFRGNSEIYLREVNTLLEDEFEQIGKVNDTEIVFENINKTIDQLFSEKAKKYPEKLGLVDVNSRLTLEEIDTLSTKLASHIVDRKLADSLIAIYMEPSVDVIISILAIFKSGSAYLPIDTELPAERIQYILEDSGAKCMVSTKKYLKTIDFDKIVIDVENPSSWTFSSSIEESLNTPEKLAYVIYTSGSTGKPKGVPIRQNQLNNYVQWFTKTLNYTHEDNSILLSSFAFDLGHSAVFPTLVNGGTLHMLTKEAYLDIEYLNTYLSTEQISFIKATPTLFSLIINESSFDLNAFTYLRYLMLGGEAINYDDLTIYFNHYPDKKIINHYGPTEATIGCIVKPLSKENYHEIKSASIIGRPISNMKTYILDKYLKPVAPGVLGQLYLSGVSVSKGYHNKPELTTKTFIKNPLTTSEMMYATGDLACWSSNNEIIFKGRIDDQLKIRGYRIELGEINKVINQISFVKKSSILIKENTGGKFLIAFVETKESGKELEIRSLLDRLLPTYMIPNSIFEVEKIPVTPNGKTDKKALENLLPEYTEEGELPTTKTEKEVTALWEDVLNIEVRDINTSFFILGGHSLRALKLLGKIEQKLHKKVSLKEFFTAPTIKALACKIEEKQVFNYRSITTIEERAFYPVSYSQRRLWLLHEFSENKTAYNMPSAYWLEGDMNIEAFHEALYMLIKRHEILRTVFKEIQGEAKQIVIPMNEFKIPLIVENLIVEGKELEVLISNLGNRPFNLSKGPLIDVRIYKKEESKHLLFMNLHHIISDGWSATILMTELSEYYNSLVTGEIIETSDLKIQYKDYAVWQQQQFKNNGFEKSKAFWKEKLGGELTRFSLPKTYKVSKDTANEGKTLYRIINNDLLIKLESMAIELNVSLYMLLLTGFKALAYRYTGTNDILIGTVVAGREKEELSEQLGFYVNTIAQRTQINDRISFKELLAGIKEDLLETATHQYYPFDQVVSDLELSYTGGEQSLFDIMFIHQNNEEVNESVELGELQVKAFNQTELIESKFDISFVTKQLNEGLQVFVEYNRSIYSEAFLNQFLNHYEAILEVVLGASEKPIAELNYIGSRDKAQLVAFNRTKQLKEYTTIHQKVEETVARNPLKEAIVFNQVSLSYEELNAKANALANLIISRYEPEKDTIIAFSIERSEWQIIAMLAILKTGAAFLPIDCKQPTKRKNLILEDASPLLVICDESLDVENKNLNVEKLAELKESVFKYSKENLNEKIASEDLAYVIYTSGSTGKPKGVQIEHRGNINMITHQINELGITKEDVCLQFASISFDASVYEIFIALYAGSTLVLVEDDCIASPIQFVRYINEKKVSFATLPPAYLSGLDKEKLCNLKKLVTAGDSPNLEDTKYFSQKLNYFNAYGPTEYSVCATLYKIKGNEKVIPIGKPISNTAIYVLDSAMNIMPIGCWGELYLSGHGIARGYINRPEKNAEVFLNNPFNSKQRLYKTGDIGRWLPDGNIEFGTRSEEMIKIRGYRVEKGEISTVLLTHQLIEEVAIYFDSVQQNLIAYIVTNTPVVVKEVKEFLKNQLPEYMVPTFIVEVDKILLTTNGKIDYKKLQSVSKNVIEIDGDTEIVKPINEIEERLLTIWKEVLKKENLSISTVDNFFEIGGQSISAIAMIGSIWSNFEREIKLKDLLMRPTIKELSVFLESEEKSSESLVVALNEVKNYQQKLFMIPPVIGTSLIYRPLSQKLADEQIRCFGVQYKGFDSDEKLDVSIEEMAKNMFLNILPHLEKEQPNIVLGYSMGALLAIEIVAYIEKEGFPITLILVDKNPENNIADLYGNNSLLEKKEIVDKIVNKHIEEFNLPEISKVRIHNLVQNNFSILETYKGYKKVLRSNILALEAKENNKKNKMKAWGKITNSKFDHVSISGNHYTIFENKNLSELSELIAKFINKNQIF